MTSAHDINVSARNRLLLAADPDARKTGIRIKESPAPKLENFPTPNFPTLREPHRVREKSFAARLLAPPRHAKKFPGFGECSWRLAEDPAPVRASHGC
jgi:hypothetical protein